MTKALNFIKRLIASPFVLGLMLIAHNWFVVKRIIQFLRFGGEFASYDSETECATIDKIYKELKKNNTLQKCQ